MDCSCSKVIFLFKISILTVIFTVGSCCQAGLDEPILHEMCLLALWNSSLLATLDQPDEPAGTWRQNIT